MTARQVRAQYTQEFKMEAVRQVRAGQAIAVVAKVLGIPKASLGVWAAEISRMSDEALDQGRYAFVLLSSDNAPLHVWLAPCKGGSFAGILLSSCPHRPHSA